MNYWAIAVWTGVFVIGMFLTYLVCKRREKEANIVNHVLKIVCDSLTIISGTLIASYFLKADEQQFGMILVLLSFIICLQIVFEVIGEPIRKYKITMAILLIFPLSGVFYGTLQFQNNVEAGENQKDTSGATNNYVSLVQNRDMSVREQEGNEIQLSKEDINFYGDFFSLKGKIDSDTYIYGENPSDNTPLFLTKADDQGYFSTAIPRNDVADLSRIDLYVNHISISADDTVYKDKATKPDSQLNIKEIDEKQALSSGSYTVGTDCKAGEYILLAKDTGQINWLNDSSNSKSFDNSLYVKLSENDVIEIQGAEMFPVTKHTAFVPNKVDNGMLKVGTDIESGRYQIKATNDYAIAKKYKDSISNKLEEDSVIDSQEVELKDNEYIYLMNTQLIKNNGGNEK